MVVTGFFAQWWNPTSDDISGPNAAAIEYPPLPDKSSVHVTKAGRIVPKNKKRGTTVDTKEPHEPKVVDMV